MIPHNKFMLVYQAGIANIFRVREFNTHHAGVRSAQRIYQGDFKTAEVMFRGMMIAGAQCDVAACNMAGDITNQVWTRDLESQPFFEAMNVAVARRRE